MLVGLLAVAAALEPVDVRDSGLADGEYTHYTHVNDAPAYLLEDGARMFELFRDAGQTWKIQAYERTYHGCVEMDKMEYGLVHYFNKNLDNRPPASGWEVAEGLRQHIAQEGLQQARVPRVSCRDACCLNREGTSDCPGKPDVEPSDEEKQHVKNIIQFGLPTAANLNAYLARRRAQYHPSYVVIDNFLDDPMHVSTC